MVERNALEVLTMSERTGRFKFFIHCDNPDYHNERIARGALIRINNENFTAVTLCN